MGFLWSRASKTTRCALPSASVKSHKTSIWLVVARPDRSTSCSSRVVSTPARLASWLTMLWTTSSYSSPGAGGIERVWLAAPPSASGGPRSPEVP